MNVNRRDINEIIGKLEYIRDMMQEKGIEELPTNCNTYGMYQFVSFGNKGYLNLDLEAIVDKIEEEEQYD